jgi:NAD-dependent deacetylase
MFAAQLIESLRQARQIVVLTGAGTSAESGVPTFRDAQTGLWAQYNPAELATPEAFKRNPKLVWDWYSWRRETVFAAKPNAGHYALVQMARHVPNFHLITQNVDGLHQRAGSEQVIELHGNITRIRCQSCSHSIDLTKQNLDSLKFSDTEPPRCASCNHYYRPDVVWFGENLPVHALQQAEQLAQSCDVFFSIGTSSQVYPAAALPLYATKAVVIEINREKTALTQQADFALQGASGEILPALVESVWG